ncbi:OmpA family protein [Patescibacteria group bacterium]|nr:OmpA family protein [Patescibacteria group bacterium]MBU2233251.1 OmpA family protein [Patescibacteria group bacterium]
MMIVAAGEADIKAKVTNVEFVTGFDIGKVDIQSGMMPVLDKIAKVLVTRPDATVIVEGEADASCIERLTFKESEDYNLQLSLKRAEAVKSYLIGKGVPANKIKAMGIGRVAAETRSEARGVRVQLFWIATSDIELVGLKAACQVAQAVAESAADRAVLAAIAAAGRTAAAEAEAKAWAAEAKAQADRAEDERKKAEAIAKALEEKDVSPAVPVVVQETASTTSGWLKSIGIGGNAPDYGFVSVQTKFLAVTIAGADGFYGAGVTYRLMNRIEISALVSREKYEKAWAEMRNLQAIYTIPVTDKISVGLGADYGVIRPFSANDAKISGKIFSPLVKAGVELGAGWVLGANYAPRFLSLSSDELSRDAKADEFSLTIAKLFLLGGGGKNE